MDFTLPSRFYTSEDIFRAEMERFFFGSWIYAGHTARIPNSGDYFLLDVAGESIIVARDTSGAANAWFNVCRHRGTRLCDEPEGNFAGRIICPYHGWTYGLDGCLLGAPHMNQPEFSRGDFGLHRAQTKLWDGHIFVHLGLDPGAVSEQTAGLGQRFAPWRMQDLAFARRITYDVNANWKLIVANYNECLHCPLVHPQLNRLTDYLGAENEAGPGYVGGSMGFRHGVETMSTDGIRRRDYFPGLSESERREVCYYAIYPNLLLSLHPDYMMTHSLWPRAADRTKVVCDWYFHPDEIAKADFVATDAIELWDVTNRQDWRMVELSQLGVQSRAYSPGPYSPREELLSAFDKMILRAAEDNPGRL
jgi:Rieske 2Fe-2S family protein